MTPRARSAFEAQIFKKEAILVNDPGDLVMRVLKTVKLTGGKIASMVISGHGTLNGIKIGKYWVDNNDNDKDNNFRRWVPIFMMLRPFFTKDAIVTLSACDVAIFKGNVQSGPFLYSEPFKLMQALSTLWGGVRVKAWTGSVDPYKIGPIRGVRPEGEEIICIYNICVPVSGRASGPPPGWRVRSRDTWPPPKDAR
jgi:hypothetical protein